MKPALEVHNLSKQYRVGKRPGEYQTLRESIAKGLRRPFERRHSRSKAFVWALKNVSFEVGWGEVVGIIGRNGAGKSTLLKILSRITQPTDGEAAVYGRVGSLLEVGTGFHPELTGRENIELNGAILGMTRAEIRRKFDQIVAFAEVDKYLDTAIKHYSSGMYLRLAFSVAAFLEPDILMLDEVLSVGDASFQRKCLEKMEDVGRHGRTVLFVSHDLQAVTRLCKRAILLEQGAVVTDGPADSVVSTYLRSGSGSSRIREWADLSGAPGNEIVRLCAVRVVAHNTSSGDSVDIRRPVQIEMEFDVVTPGHVLVPNYDFYNSDGVCVFIAIDQDPLWRRRPRNVGRYISTVWIPGNFLAEGMLMVGAAMTTLDPLEIHFYERQVVAFQVVDSLEGNSARGDFGGKLTGVLRPMLRWTTRYKQVDVERPVDARGTVAG
jgi:lipopolysaccharide transport system ATP-binding protein